MKKIVLFTMFILCGLVLFTGCGGRNESPSSSMGDPPSAITVRSMQELNEMREMILCQDEQRVSEYLGGLEGGGAEDREDLVFFVDLVDSVPYVTLIEGDASWISYRKSEKAEMLYITMEAPNGDWMRIEYFLSAFDVQASIGARVAAQADGETFSPPLQSKDGSIKVYHEARAPHPSGIGDSITWTVDIGGIFANIVFYDSKGDTLYPQTALPSTSVASFH